MLEANVYRLALERFEASPLQRVMNLGLFVKVVRDFFLAIGQLSLLAGIYLSMMPAVPGFSWSDSFKWAGIILFVFTTGRLFLRESLIDYFYFFLAHGIIVDYKPTPFHKWGLNILALFLTTFLFGGVLASIILSGEDLILHWEVFVAPITTIIVVVGVANSSRTFDPLLPSLASIVVMVGPQNIGRFRVVPGDKVLEYLLEKKKKYAWVQQVKRPKANRDTFDEFCKGDMWITGRGLLEYCDSEPKNASKETIDSSKVTWMGPISFPNPKRYCLFEGEEYNHIPYLERIGIGFEKARAKMRPQSQGEKQALKNTPMQDASHTHAHIDIHVDVEKDGKGKGEGDLQRALLSDDSIEHADS